MAGKKKKKASANPARGFATVSQPSKAKDSGTLDDDEQSQSQNASKSDVKTIESSIEAVKATVGNDESVSIEQMTPAELETHLENAGLRHIVEEHGSRVRADAARHASRLKNERRQLQQQADDAILYGVTDDLISDLAMNDNQNLPIAANSLLHRSNPDVEGEGLLLKLWSLQEILTALKFRSTDQALDSVLRTWHQFGINVPQQGVWGLDEALAWYASIEGNEKLATYEFDDVASTNSGTQTPLLDATVDDLQGLDAQDNTVNEKSLNTSRSENSPSESETTMTSSDEDIDPDGLIDRWIALQIKVFEKTQQAETKNEGRPEAKHRKLFDRIQKIERDVLFDKEAALHRWQPMLRDLEIDYGRQKKQLERGVPKIEKEPNLETQEVNALDDDAVLGDIFVEPETELSSNVTEDSRNTIVTHDFGSWTGVHPRRLLEEASSDITSRNGVKFQSIHTTSFSSRIQLHLHMKTSLDIAELSVQCLPQGIFYSLVKDNVSRLTLKMVSTATRNISQSEAYLSTLALFLLSSSKTINSKIASRLPKIWKELLADLENARDEAIIKDDTEKLRQLRSIVRQLPTNGDQDSSNSEPQNVKNVVALNRTKHQASPRDSSDQAKTKWQQRAMSSEYASMQKTRQDLPVYQYKEEILQAFHVNPVLIICADTGAGKSTQIPSYILEEELCGGQDYNILVTQPRRISAISIARRVSSELGEDREAIGTTRSLIGYAIRMESKVCSATRITFATTGVLLRMLQDSPDLDHINCLVLDEVHERTMDLDLLFIALKRLRLRRQSLKIVLMSATVDATKFSRYFDNAPVLDIPGRTFPVGVKFLEDAIETTLDIKVAGSDPKALRDYEDTDDTDAFESPGGETSGLDHYSLATRRALTQYNYRVIDYDIIIKLATAIATKPEFTAYSKAMLIFMPGISEIRRLHNLMSTARTFSRGWVIHMLHSSFSTQDLEKAFLLPPPGCRKIVIATNIAETGITIPDVTAVIDTCKEKVMRFDERRQISRLTEGFIARASARQRKGRAARVQEGLCFHLVTRHHFETKLQDQPIPEMLRLSLQDPILRVKIWDLGGAEEILSAALDPPSLKNIRRAITKLQDVGAIDSAEKLTALGRNLAKLPLDVALGKMAIYGVFFQSLDAIITIIASLSTKTIFIKDEAAKIAPETLFARGDSDFLTVYNAYSGWKKAHKQGAAQQFCQKNRLNQFILRQLEEEKIQLLTYLADAGLMSLTADEHVNLQGARHNRSNLFRFEIPARYDRLNSDAMTNAIVAMALYPKLLRREGGLGYRNVYSNQQLQLAQTSVHRLATTTGGKPPEWLCYLEATQSKSGRLNALHSSRVTQATILLLLGQAEFKHFAKVIDIDHGRVRFSLRKWKELLALQRLRSETSRMIHNFLDQPASSLSLADQTWLDVLAGIIEGSSPSGGQLPPKRVLQLQPPRVQ